MNASRTLVLCLCSALLGAVLATVWSKLPSSVLPAQAQEAYRVPARQAAAQPGLQQPGANRTDESGRSPEANRTPLALGPAPTLEGVEELTPEERVNVAVYEGCNRSVVNIKTEASSTSMFLLDL